MEQPTPLELAEGQPEKLVLEGEQLFVTDEWAMRGEGEGRSSKGNSTCKGVAQRA